MSISVLCLRVTDPISNKGEFVRADKEVAYGIQCFRYSRGDNALHVEWKPKSTL